MMAVKVDDTLGAMEKAWAQTRIVELLPQSLNWLAVLVKHLEHQWVYMEGEAIETNE